MNVILLEKIGKLGTVGDTANVKSGYARNFLFPTGKAIPATKANLDDFESRRDELMAAHNAHIAASRKRANKIKNLKLRIEVNAGDEGKLFGSVGTKDIAEAINEEVKGADVTKSEVHLPHGALREIGDYEITIDFDYDVTETISLSLVHQQSAGGVSDDGTIEETMDEDEADKSAAGSAKETARKSKKED